MRTSQDLGAVVRQELAQAQRDLLALVRQREGVEARIAQLEAEVAGLERLVKKYSPNGSGADEAGETDWSSLTRAVAVERLLRSSEDPMSAFEMVREFRKHGRRGDTPNSVSGTLSRLKKAGKAKPYGGRRGYWVWAGNNAPQEPTPQETEERPDSETA